jgi:hypothetical protein
MCKRNKIKNLDNLIIKSQTLDEYKKEILKIRYLRILWDFQNRCKFYSWIYHLCRIIVTVGSLLVPALMSIQYSKENLFSFTQSMEIPIYWTTWSISLMVTIANGFFTLFKIDKKYYFLHSIYEKLQSEGHQYFSLTGKYSGILNKNKRRPTHENQFIYFCHNIEKIKMSQVFEEFLKINDNTSTSNHQSDNRASNPSHNPMSETMNMNRLGSLIPDGKIRISEESSSNESNDSVASGEDRIPNEYNGRIYIDSMEVQNSYPRTQINSPPRRVCINITREPSSNISCIDDGNESDKTSVHST